MSVPRTLYRFPFECSPMMPFQVNEWGSHPDEGNDDLYCGQDYLTIEEATAAFEEADDVATAYVELTGPDGRLQLRRNPYSRCEEPSDDREYLKAWQRERAMEAGMMGGCDAYNDAMGYGSAVAESRGNEWSDYD